jgi:hypothetical protein
VSYANGVEPFKKIVAEAEEPNPYTHLKSLDQEATCQIAQAADLCQFLTDGLLKTEGVFRSFARATKAAWTEVGRRSQTISWIKTLIVGGKRMVFQNRSKPFQFRYFGVVHWE